MEINGWDYLQIGFEHITDPGGADHIFFILALTANFSLRHWKSLLVLITAFTLGHTLTLLLATLQVVTVSSAWIEFLIPITIVLTALYNLAEMGQSNTTPIFSKSKSAHIPSIRVHYTLAAVFGLIHGLGFSGYLRSLLGRESDLWQPLLSFNIGLEVGQLLVVAFALLLVELLAMIPNVKRNQAALFLSGAAAGPAVIMTLERFPA